MPVFAYDGLSAEGKAVAGIVDAESPRTARQKLRKQGVFPTGLREAPAERARSGGAKSALTAKITFERVTAQDLALATRQLSTLVSADLPIVECLTALIEQVDRERLKRTLSQIREQVNQGSSLADAMVEHSRLFGELYINMVRAGEASGALDIVLLRLAEYTEGAARLRSRVRSALTYPLVMVFVGGAILMFLLAYVVPKLTRIFVESKQVLPLPTRALMFLSDFTASWWWLMLIVIAALVFSFRAYVRTPAGRIWADRTSLALPVFGKVKQKIAIARFARTLSTLLKSGISLLPSLDIVKNVVENVVVSKAIEEARDAIREGQSIAPPLKKSGVFPPLIVHMIAVGEKSGQLEAMLSKAAEAYEQEVDVTVATLTTLLEPVMIVAMGGTVMFIVLAILLPVFQMSSLVR